MDENIEALIEQVQKIVKGATLTVGSHAKYKTRWLPMGIRKLDAILGGGLPFGRIVLFKGDFSSGKTFLAQKAIQAAQQGGLTCAYIDVERGMDGDWFKATGIDLDKLIVSRPDSGEEALDVAIALVRAGVNLVVLDSVAALTPTAEIEGTMENHLMGARARLLNQGLRKLTRENHGDSIVILINQPMLGIGPGPFPTEALPAGKGQWFYSGIVLDIRRRQWLKEDDKRVGFEMQLRTEKNKVAPPQQTCEIPFVFEECGFDLVRGLVSVALDVGVISQRGAFYSCSVFPDGKIRGKDAMIHFLKTNEDAVVKLQEKVSGVGKPKETSENS